MYEVMRKYFTIYKEAVSHKVQYMTLHPIPLNILIYEENFIFFISVVSLLIVYENEYDSYIQ